MDILKRIFKKAESVEPSSPDPMEGVPPGLFQQESEPRPEPRVGLGKKKNRSIPLHPFVPAISFSIGVACLVALGALTVLAKMEAERRIQTSEDEMITISYPEERKGTQLMYDDIAQIPLKVRGLKWISPVFRMSGVMEWSEKSHEVAIAGVTSDMFKINKLQASHGRVLRELDMNMNFCVLGVNAYEIIGENTTVPKPGSTVLINGVPFTVLGILEKAQGLHSSFVDNLVLIHLKTMERHMDARSEGFLQAMTFHGVRTGPVAYGIANELKNQLWDTPVSLIHGDAMKDQLNTQIKANMVSLGVAGAISLLLGVVGMVSALISQVNRRKAELVVRSLYGSNGMELYGRYGMEGFAWGFAASVAGLAGGVVITDMASQYIGWPFMFPYDIMPLAAFFTFGSIVLFTVFPAIRASQIDLAGYLRSADEFRGV